MQLKQLNDKPLWLLLVTSILLGIGFYAFPWVGDDLNFRAHFIEHFRHGTPVEYRDIFTAFNRVIHTINARLANLTMLHLMFLPQCINAVLSALASFVSIYFGLILIGKRQNLTAAALACASFVMFLPWSDQMYIFDFQLNYLWGTSIALVYCYLLINKSIHWSVALIGGIFVGAWQECCSLPLFVAFVVLLIVNKRFRKAAMAAAVIGLLLGLIWLWASPGGQNYRSFLQTYNDRSEVLLLTSLPIIVYVLLTIYLLIKRKKIDVNDILFCAITITSFAILYFFPTGPRIVWFGDWVACLGIINYLTNTNSKVVTLLSAMLFGLMVIHIIIVDKLCFTERTNYNKIIDSLRITKSNEPIFVDMLNREDLPLIALQKPQVDNFSRSRNTQLITSFYKDYEVTPSILPRELKNLQPTDGEKIDGDNGFRCVNGYIVGPWVLDRPCSVWMNAYFGDKLVDMQFYIVPFEGCNSKKYAWYHYDRSTIYQLLSLVPNKIEFKD